MKTRDITPFGLRMEPSLKELLASEAARQERSLNWLICKLLKEAMQSNEQIKQA